MHSGLLRVSLGFSTNLDRLCLDTVELIVPYGYFEKSGKMHVRSLSFKAFESIQCVVKLSIT